MDIVPQGLSRVDMKQMELLRSTHKASISNAHFMYHSYHVLQLACRCICSTSNAQEQCFRQGELLKSFPLIALNGRQVR